MIAVLGLRSLRRLGDVLRAVAAGEVDWAVKSKTREKDIVEVALFLRFIRVIKRDFVECSVPIYFSSAYCV